MTKVTHNNFRIKKILTSFFLVFIPSFFFFPYNLVVIIKMNNLNFGCFGNTRSVNKLRYNTLDNFIICH